jgi:hypothetical protein
MIVDLIQTKFDVKRGETGECLFSLMGHKESKNYDGFIRSKTQLCDPFFSC